MISQKLSEARVYEIKKESRGCDLKTTCFSSNTACGLAK